MECPHEHSQSVSYELGLLEAMRVGSWSAKEVYDFKMAELFSFYLEAGRRKGCLSGV